MKNFNFGGIHSKIWLLRGCSQKTNIEAGLPRKTGFDSLSIWGRGLGKKEDGGVFDGGLTP